MKLSAVIPAYNEEALLSRCLTSIVEQVEQAGMEAEIINDVIFQEDPSGMRLVTIKRQVRIQKDPL